MNNGDLSSRIVAIVILCTIVGASLGFGATLGYAMAAPFIP